MFTKTQVLGLTLMILTMGIIKPSQGQVVPSNIVNQNNFITNNIIAAITRHHSYDDFFLEGHKKIETEIKVLLQEKEPAPVLKIKTDREK
jgi:hypothetical protein